MCIYVYTYVHIIVYKYTCVYMCVYIYIYIYTCTRPLVVEFFRRLRRVAVIIAGILFDSHVLLSSSSFVDSVFLLSLLLCRCCCRKYNNC